MKYADFYSDSTNNPEEFWKQQAENIHWHSKPKTILSKDDNDYPVWFHDGQLNVC